MGNVEYGYNICIFNVWTLISVRKKQFEKRPLPRTLLSFRLRLFMSGALRDVIKTPRDVYYLYIYIYIYIQRLYELA